jgi:predicted Zn finger-like uncharacterized protein
MIIQCKACKSKYRFDEAAITGEGVWVRCSRCQNLFFQMSPPEMRVGKKEVVPETFMDKTLPLERELLPEYMEEDMLPVEPEKKSALLIWVLGFILVMMIAAGVIFFLYPAAGDIILKQISTVFPAAGGLLRQDANVPAIGPAQVKIVDLKQRFVENAIMGNIRVVEGMAVNGSPEPMTRIKVRAELYDLIGTPVRQNVAYCGNLLTDQELKTATEEQIARKLAIPQGTDISNDRVTPNGMIPFMIIFLREPPGVTKTLVMPIEAERLLP